MGPVVPEEIGVDEEVDVGALRTMDDAHRFTGADVKGM